MLISKEQNCMFRGVCALIILLHHTGQATHAIYLFPFTHVGYFAVAVFLFLSGYGTLYCIQEKKDYLKNFVWIKIKSILLPFWICNLLRIIFRYYFLNSLQKPIILYLVGIRLVDMNAWYIQEQMLLYLFTLLCFTIAKGKKALIGVAICSVVYMIVMCVKGSFWWIYAYTLTFVLGMCAKQWEVQIQRIRMKMNRFALIVATIGFCVSYLIGKRNTILLPACMIVCSIFVAVMIITFSSYSFKLIKMWNLFGSISLELYLVQGGIIRIIGAILPGANETLLVVMMVISSIAVAGLFHIILLKVFHREKKCAKY